MLASTRGGSTWRRKNPGSYNRSHAQHRELEWAQDAPQLIWRKFSRYSTVAIASVDDAGQMGPLSAEMPIASLLTKP